MLKEENIKNQAEDLVLMSNRRSVQQYARPLNGGTVRL